MIPAHAIRQYQQARALAGRAPALSDVHREMAERKLSDFIRVGWPCIEPVDYITNWHIEAICEHLEGVSRGQVRRLIINVPPRHMKSIATSVAWPAWTWCQRPVGPLLGPAVQWMFASYSHQLSVEHSLKCRRLIESRWYQRNWGDRYRIVVDQNTKMRFENDAKGVRLATSVGGALTGYGGSIIVVDDAHKTDEAESETVREGTLKWWDEAMSTRLNDPRTGAYVIIMQRVHDRDLVGHILGRNHKDWTVLCLPARYEHDHPYVYGKDPRTRDGDILWPARVPEAELNQLEATLGSYASAGQLQQRPAPREGGIFKRGWFITAKDVPSGCRRVRAWDLAATEQSAKSRDPDWTVGVLMARDNAGFYYIEDVQRLRGSPHEVERRIVAMAHRDGVATTISIPEDPGQAGKAQAQYLARQLAGFNIRSERESGAKDVRAMPFAAQAEAGNVRMLPGAWNQAFLNEFETFPMGAHDDQVDAASGAFMQLAKRPARPLYIPRMGR